MVSFRLIIVCFIDFIDFQPKVLQIIISIRFLKIEEMIQIYWVVR